MSKILHEKPRQFRVNFSEKHQGEINPAGSIFFDGMQCAITRSWGNGFTGSATGN